MWVGTTTETHMISSRISYEVAPSKNAFREIAQLNAPWEGSGKNAAGSGVPITCVRRGYVIKERSLGFVGPAEVATAELAMEVHPHSCRQLLEVPNYLVMAKFAKLPCEISEF